MTHPTKALARLMMRQYIKRTKYAQALTVDGMDLRYDEAKIEACLSRVECVRFGELVRKYNASTLTLLEIQAHRAGHVLGAAMFSVRCRRFSPLDRTPLSIQTVFYTGDFNMIADRHLDGARVSDMLPPSDVDVLITEATYGTKSRGLRGAEERKLTQAVQQTIERGGKVLISVFAIGRVWELCCVLDAHWTRMGIENVPIYFSLERSNPESKRLYSKYSHWARSGVNILESLRHIKFSFDDAELDSEGPMCCSRRLVCSNGLSHAACHNGPPTRKT